MAEGEADGDREGGASRCYLIRESTGIDAVEWPRDLHRDAPRRCEVFGEPGKLGTASRQDDLADALGFRGGGEVVERALDLERKLAGYRFDRRRDLGRVGAIAAQLRRFRRGKRDRQCAGDRLGVTVAAEWDVTREDRRAPARYVRLHDGRADVDEGHGLVGALGHVELVLVLHGEAVDVDDGGRET